ncbi:hypothetical protein F5882DRAFT_375161 [Hyaloscypha sp. PMI_1271]|nr:hypothetical protein F5882DRAFT_375161 [Hyaloscypha sp. PMI_1271]
MSSAESDTQNQQTIAAIRYKPYSKYSTAPSTAYNQQPNQPYNDYPSTHSTRQNQQTSLTNSSQPCTCGERIQAHLTAQTAEVQLEDSLDKLSGTFSIAFPGEDAISYTPAFPAKGASTSKPTLRRSQKPQELQNERGLPVQLAAEMGGRHGLKRFVFHREEYRTSPHQLRSRSHSPRASYKRASERSRPGMPRTVLTTRGQISTYGR